MKITYTPSERSNYHRAPSLTLIVPDNPTAAGYIITRRQNRTVERHFCGIADCQCPAGASVQIDEAGTRYALRSEWCVSIHAPARTRSGRK